MISLLKLLILLLSLGFGIICLVAPMSVMRIIAWWPKFVFTRLFPGPKIHPGLQEALLLIDSASDEDAGKLKGALGIIKRTGIIALLVALVGFCLAVLEVSHK